jgi:chromosome segregation ATPase
MWNSFADRAKELAVKAAAAAADIDKQLNESVGIPDSSTPTLSETLSGDADADADAEDTLNDVWADDFNVDSPATPAVETIPESTASKLPAMPVPELEEETVTETETVSPLPAPSVPEKEPQPETQSDGNHVEGEGGWDEDNLQFDEVPVDTEPTESLEQEKHEEPTAQYDDSVPEPVPEEKPVPTPSQEEPSSAWNGAEPAEQNGGGMDNPSEQQQQVPESTVAPPTTITALDNAVVEEEVAATVDLPTVTHTPVHADVGDPPETVPMGEEKHTDGWVEDDDLDVDEGDSTTSAVVVESEPSPLQPEAQAQAEVAPEKVEEPLVEVATATATVRNDLTSKHVSSLHTDEQFASQQEIACELEQQVQALQQQLRHREDQLVSKTEQMSTVQAMHETEKQELQAKIQNTKEEAKKRIQKARERVEATEAKLKNASAAKNSTADDAAQQAEMIAALRAEGEKLARKQSEMEQAVRAAKGETRVLREQLEVEMLGKDKALENIAKLETDLKSTKDNLSAARRGESQAGKLESGLQQAREESERKSAAIMSLEQQVKEFKAETKDLHIELEAAMKGAAVENEREQKKWRKEHHNVSEDLENKLRNSEREAGVREDALRHEVAELRKRWQDAVRRADSLSMDSQSSTAPLLRQLDSIHRQNRARASAWAELETKLRSELEENVIANEKLSRERSDLKTKCSRLERTANELEGELKATRSSLEDKSIRVKQLEEKLADMEAEGAKMKGEWAEVERLANEGVSRVRSEMTVTVVESEERHRSQLDALEAELRQEREKHTKLEGQVQSLIKNAEMIVPQEILQQSSETNQLVKPKKLRQSESQTEILAGALTGLGGDDSDDEEEEEDHEGENGRRNSGSGSFAALEELTSRLKAARVELTTLRKSFADAERSRKELAEELGESRSAKEKLPLFEAKVSELTSENRQQSLEIQALQEDIVEVRGMYRTQLNLLLEEKAASEAEAAATTESPAIMNGTDDAPVEESIVPEEDSNE